MGLGLEQKRNLFLLEIGLEVIQQEWDRILLEWPLAIDLRNIFVWNALIQTVF